MADGCVIFDFDGVIADTEALHLQAYNFAFTEQAAALGKAAPPQPQSLQLTADQYFAKYIVYGNREGFAHMLTDGGYRVSEPLLDALCQSKDRFFEGSLHRFAEPLPGVRQLLEWLDKRSVPRAICSGAARREIHHLLDLFGVRDHFDFIITIEDVRYGKPDPEGYNLAFQKLYEKYDAGLAKPHSLVIEDSAGGCSAAKAAGIPVLGVATSLPLARLLACADHALPDLSHLDYGELGRWLGMGG
ncbi:MAG: HAD family phosphatase [Phycisphaerae bacterium]